MSFPPPPNGNFQGQYGAGYQFVGNNSGVLYQCYQSQGQMNPPNQVHDIFAHPNQNPNLFQQNQFSTRPPNQQQNYYFQQNYQPPPPRPNPSQYFPPMGQYHQHQTQQQSYPPIHPQNSRMPPPPPPPPPQKNLQDNSNDVIQIPPELNCPADSLNLDTSSLSSIYKPYRSPFSISDDATKEVHQKDQNIPNSNNTFAYIPPPFSFDPKSENCCSFLKTGRQPTTGNYYICYTCQQKIPQNQNNVNQIPVIVCESCAKKCHIGHALQKISPYTTAFCNCGAGDIFNIERNSGPNNNSNCKCQIVPINITSCIICNNNNNTKNQNPLFYCETCSKKYGNNCIVCNSCASICHSGHKLNPAGFGNACKCYDCKTCKLFGQIQQTK